MVFSKISFPKTPELRFALQVPYLGCEKSFKKFIWILLVLGLPETTKV